jgi:ABC-type nitrate/sulfonate/bicarbonate transport system permease component
MTPSSSTLTDPTATDEARARRTVPGGGPAARAGYGAVGALILLAGWQGAAMGGVFGNGLPTASATLLELLRLAQSASFWSETALTVGLAAAGLALATAIGVVLGILIGSFAPVRSATLAITELLKPIPPIVILPLAVMILGPTAEMALLLVVIGLALAISIQTIAGVADTDPVALATARSYGLGRLETLWRITLPAALPFIGTAVRVSAPASLVVVVVAGLLGGAPGLGRSIYQAQAGGLYPTLYALVVVLGILGLASQAASTALERRALHWHPSYRKASP